MKLWEYFVHKDNVNNDFIQLFLLFHVSLWRTVTYHEACMFIPVLAIKLQRIQVLRQNAGSCVSSTTRMHKHSNRGKKELLHKVVIFVFFVHNMYSRSFLKLRLNHWCHMAYFTYVLTTFLGLERVNCVAVYGGQKALICHQKYLM